MGRIRTVKPELFLHDELFDAEAESGLPVRLAFIGLFTVADREGRFIWRPRQLKAQIFPYDAGLDFELVLDALVKSGFVVHYEVDGKEFGVISSFLAHQQINSKEAQSKLPAPVKGKNLLHNQPLSERKSPVPNVHMNSSEFTSPVKEANGNSYGEGKGREGKGKEGVTSNDVCSELEISEIEISEPKPDVVTESLIEFPVNRKDQTWNLDQEFYNLLCETYPAVDVWADLLKAKAWLVSNPSKRKTRRGMTAFLNNWMGKEQDRGGRHENKRPTHSGGRSKHETYADHIFNAPGCESLSPADQASIFGERPIQNHAAEVADEIQEHVSAEHDGGREK